LIKQEADSQNNYTINKEVVSMAEVEFMGKTFTIDEDGFIETYEEGKCEEWIQYVKQQEGIDELNDEHRKVLDMLHDYYEKNGIAPMVRVLSKVTKFKLKHIYELFPSGPGKGACKMAGLPKPTGCV
jgi:tRNA 2-thiouridine synthesizing protein E